MFQLPKSGIVYDTESLFPVNSIDISQSHGALRLSGVVYVEIATVRLSKYLPRA